MSRLDGSQLDPVQSPVVRRELPGLMGAFDAELMRTRLQEALFGGARPRAVIETCAPGQGFYYGDCCVLRYKLEVVEKESGHRSKALVIGRVFRDREASARYLRDRLLPLAAEMRGREEVANLSTPVAALEPLNAVVYAFPIDGELPTLVGATDPRRILEILRVALPTFLGDRSTVEDCRVELAQYGRHHRCVLRYHVETRTAAPAGSANGDASHRQGLGGRVCPRSAEARPGRPR